MAGATETEATECGTDCLHRRATDQRFNTIEERLSMGDKSLEMLPQLLKEMRKLTSEVSSLKTEVAKTAEVVVAWGNIKGFAKAMKWVSAFLKTAAITGTACVTIYMIFTHQYAPAEEMVKTLKNN